MYALETRPPNIVYLENGMLNMQALEGGLELETMKFWVRRRLINGIEDFLREKYGTDDRQRAEAFKVLWDMSPVNSHFRKYLLEAVTDLLPDFWACDQRRQTRAYIDLVCKIDNPKLYELIQETVRINDRSLRRPKLVALGWRRFLAPPAAETRPRPP